MLKAVTGGLLNAEIMDVKVAARLERWCHDARLEVVPSVAKRNSVDHQGWANFLSSAGHVCLT